MAFTAFRRPRASDLSTRAAGDCVHFRCDAESDLPSANVQDGDSAYTLDSKKMWDRESSEWVERGEATGATGGPHDHPISEVTGLQAALDGKAATSHGDHALTGEMKVWPFASAPAGWLLCDGSAVSRATYAALSALFEAEGFKYGNGNGTTTFNVPNMKGRAPVGLDSGQTEFDTLGETGGAKTHQLTSSEMPSHTHTQNSHNHTQDAHTHTQNSHNHTQDAHTHTQNSHNHTQDAHSHTVTGVGSSASGGTANLTGANDASSTTATAANATATNQAATAVNQNATATNQAATATNQNATATNQAATATNQNTGGDAAHNNLQPYLVVNYIIKT